MSKKVVKRFEVSIEGTSPMLQHKFSGTDASAKAKNMLDEDCANQYAYHMDGLDSNLCIPALHVRGSIVGSFVSEAGPKEKEKY